MDAAADVPFLTEHVQPVRDADHDDPFGSQILAWEPSWISAYEAFPFQENQHRSIPPCRNHRRRLPVNERPAQTAPRDQKLVQPETHRAHFSRRIPLESVDADAERARLAPVLAASFKICIALPTSMRTRSLYLKGGGHLNCYSELKSDQGGGERIGRAEDKAVGRSQGAEGASNTVQYPKIKLQSFKMKSKNVIAPKKGVRRVQVHLVALTPCHHLPPTSNGAAYHYYSSPTDIVNEALSSVSEFAVFDILASAGPWVGQKSLDLGRSVSARECLRTFVKACLVRMLPSATGRSVSASPCWCNRLVVMTVTPHNARLPRRTSPCTNIELVKQGDQQPLERVERRAGSGGFGTRRPPLARRGSGAGAAAVPFGGGGAPKSRRRSRRVPDTRARRTNECARPRLHRRHRDQHFHHENLDQKNDGEYWLNWYDTKLPTARLFPVSVLPASGVSAHRPRLAVHDRSFHST
ncbi:unnamed protein product [Nesidiocoris tenuis]|uniref:Uncharacterized protein n=1 Tax=Nesidiocoris tenuis TaxID=355587 RepID=A0A6H5GNG0_9HEMI|nr:unnamed protein product [Nesidiocoris tenuis]